jgi:hypothetical protein
MNPVNIKSTQFKSDTVQPDDTIGPKPAKPDAGYDKPQDPSKPNETVAKPFVNMHEPTDDKKTIPFWTQNPNILFQHEYIFEFFPVEDMTYNQKLNAISRTIILLTIIGFAFSQSVRTLLIGAITLTAIYIMYFYHTKESDKVESKKVDKKSVEGFEGPGQAYFLDNNIPIPTDVFDTPNSSNPFSNVLVTDYDYNPNKKPAPPAFNQNVNADILKQAKQFVNDANPDQPNIADKLFKDLGEQLEFEQSLRPFNSNPATTIPNDQGAFADFCYGSMISCKEGNKFACARNTSHYSIY